MDCVILVNSNVVTNDKVHVIKSFVKIRNNLIPTDADSAVILENSYYPHVTTTM